MYNNRRILHQPFFPSPTSPPPSSSQPPPSPPFPKYPFSSNPRTPFFPEYPSPPPPLSSSADPTIPANISSLTYPNSSSSSHSAPHSHSKLLLSVLFSLIALSLLILSLSFLFHRRRRRTGPTSSKPQPAKPIVPPPATSPAPPPPPTADFLYLGTVVNSRPIQGQTVNASNSPPSPYRKPGSPELRPLPPLSRNLKPNYRNATDSDDEFYSPKGSENDATATGSSSRGIFEAVADKCGFRSSGLSSPSYPDSNSAGSGSSSPIGSSPAKDWRSATPPPAPPPPPPAMRPMTPSPPKRKPPSPSPPLSPVEKGSGVSVRSPARFNQSEGNSRNQAPPSAAAPPPPPPPPPPPVGYWERQVRIRPAVTTPKSVALKGPVDFIEDSDSLEKNEETPRPKLKPLHWDKVRASSDRAMVWDQLKSSSFKLNEEMIETLFGCNTENAAPKEKKKAHPVIPLPKMENRVLDPKKSQNIAILLRALNVTKEEVCEALLEGENF